SEYQDEREGENDRASAHGPLPRSVATSDPPQRRRAAGGESRAASTRTDRVRRSSGRNAQPVAVTSRSSSNVFCAPRGLTTDRRSAGDRSALYAQRSLRGGGNREPRPFAPTSRSGSGRLSPRRRYEPRS